MKIIFDNIPLNMAFIFRGGFTAVKVAFDRASVSYPQGNEVARIRPSEVCEIEDIVAELHGFAPADPMALWVSEPVSHRTPDGRVIGDTLTMEQKLARVRHHGVKNWDEEKWCDGRA